jgi:uncharacterized protein
MDLTHIALGELAEGVLHLEGSLPPSIFDLPAGDARACGPLDYQLDLTASGDLVLATGSVAGEFELECVRCLEHFRQRVALDPYAAEIDPEGAATIDLTARLREDILLDLPAYPRCDQGISGRKCPVGDRFAAPADEPAAGTGDPDPDPAPGAWKALDGWDPSAPQR